MATIDTWVHAQIKTPAVWVRFSTKAKAFYQAAFVKEGALHSALHLNDTSSSHKSIPAASLGNANGFSAQMTWVSNYQHFKLKR